MSYCQTCNLESPDICARCYSVVRMERDAARAEVAALREELTRGSPTLEGLIAQRNEAERELAEARALLAEIGSWSNNAAGDLARAFLRRDEARVAWQNAEGTVVRSPGTFPVDKAHEHAMAMGGWVEPARDEAPKHKPGCPGASADAVAQRLYMRLDGQAEGAAVFCDDDCPARDEARRLTSRCEVCDGEVFPSHFVKYPHHRRDEARRCTCPVKPGERGFGMSLRHLPECPARDEGRGAPTEPEK